MQGISRREFLKGAAALGAAGLSLAGAGIALATEENNYSYAETITWDAQYDVVVVGFGGAGACAAVTAADAGVKVLLIDKAPLHHEGGNTRYCEQWIKHFSEDEKGLSYVFAQSGAMSHMTEEINEFIWSECNKNVAWLKELGVAENFYESYGVEYPDFPGAVGAGLSSLIIDPICTKAFWEGIRSAVVERAESIDVWLAAPAKHLLQDPLSKAVIGVEIAHNGEICNVRASKGVVLACGGYENNDFMMENFQNRAEIYPFGTEYNTGDGITMGYEVGAQMWHTGTLSGPFVAPKVGRRCYYSSMYQNFYNEEPCILVGPDGNRFCTDSGWSRHGHRPVGGDWLPQLLPHKVWAIFDETARTSGKHLCKFLSADLSEEIASGQIIQAGTIEELQEKLGIREDYYICENGEYGWEGYDESFRPSGLVKTVERYNKYCEDGFDPEFFVRPNHLAPLATPPFYAIEMFSACVNTQGGPKRNLNCEILDAFDNVIPHLYGAGELGSFYGGVYDGGGNISECMFSGRIAGIHAAEEKDALPVFPGAIPAASKLKDYGSDLLEDPDAVPASENEYIGAATGLGGRMQVGVSIEGGRIVSVRVITHGETEDIGGKAIDALPGMIVEAGSVEVDNIAGATITAVALKNAVSNALFKAGLA